LGVEALGTALAGCRRVTLDTAGCIYLLQRSSRRFELVRMLVERAARGDLTIELPGIVYLELLVRPYRSGDMTEMATIRGLTHEQPGVETVAISEHVLLASASLRALTGLKTPDALVAGSATAGESQAIIGNDRRFDVLNTLDGVELLTAGRRQLPVPKYIHLDDYVEVA
jgi:predicted nucleic acid-binding protein